MTYLRNCITIFKRGHQSQAEKKMEGIDSSSVLKQVICRFLLLRLLLRKIGAKRISVTQDYPDSVASSEQCNGGNWESLPEDMQDTIVAALPFQQVLQFRSISKAFQDILRRPTFLQPRLHHHATEGKFTPMIFFLDSATSAWQVVRVRPNVEPVE